MIQAIWEYVVKEEARGRFELAYGPGGAWSKLFGRCPGYRGTLLLRDARHPRRYLAVDLWDSEVQRAQALAEQRAEYANLQADFDGWTESRGELGVFSVVAEATVRSLPRSKRGRGRGGGRSGRRPFSGS